MIRCHNFVFVLRESETLALVIRYVYVQYAMKRYGYVLSNTDVDIFDAIRWEVGRSWTLKIFELFCAYVGIRSGDTPWCDRAFTLVNWNNVSMHASQQFLESTEGLKTLCTFRVNMCDKP